MRNTLEYPITDEEIVACLEKIMNEISQERACGDMRPLLLSKAIARIKANPQLTPFAVKIKDDSLPDHRDVLEWCQDTLHYAPKFVYNDVSKTYWVLLHSQADVNKLMNAFNMIKDGLIDTSSLPEISGI